MAIKNYTTTVDMYTSLGEIQGALAKHGAMKIMIDYIESRPIAISFVLNTALGIRGFRLPAATEAIKEFIERFEKEFDLVSKCNRGYILSKVRKALKEMGFEG